MVFGLDEYLSKTFNQKDLAKAQKEFGDVKKEIEAVDLTAKDFDAMNMSNLISKKKQALRNLEAVEKALGVKSDREEEK